WFLPEVWFLVLAVHGTMALAKVGNTVALWRKHPLMIPRPAFFRRRTARLLFSDGLAFSACCLVTGLVEYNLCGWLIGRAGGPADVALYGVLVSLTIMQLGFVIMLSAPTWPAVAESLARGDEAWAVGAARRLRVYGMGFAICASAGLVLAGPWVLELWLGREFSGISRWVFACYGLYFSAHVWRHL